MFAAKVLCLSGKSNESVFKSDLLMKKQKTGAQAAKKRLDVSEKNGVSSAMHPRRKGFQKPDKAFIDHLL